MAADRLFFGLPSKGSGAGFRIGGGPQLPANALMRDQPLVLSTGTSVGLQKTTLANILGLHLIATIQVHQNKILTA